MNVMKKMASKKELLIMLWGIYSKQKAVAADSGVDVLGEIETMRGWFRACLEGKDSDAARERLFHGKYPEVNPLVCALCLDEGMFWSDSAGFRRYGLRGERVTVRVPGFILCKCPVGTRKAEYLKHGKAPSKREEF